MTRAKGTLWVLKRIALALIVVGIVLTAISCGKPGNIYGALTGADYPSTVVMYLWGGFPVGAYYNTYYGFSPGTYEIKFTESDGTTVLLWDQVFSLTANPGTLFGDGKDKYFTIYLSYFYGAEGSGANNVAPSTSPSKSVSPQTGDRTWTQDGLTITVTTKSVQQVTGQLPNGQQIQAPSK